jgi:hypothetical protein
MELVSAVAVMLSHECRKTVRVSLSWHCILPGASVAVSEVSAEVA